MLFNQKFVLTCKWHSCQNFTQSVKILNFPSGERQVVGVSKSCSHWCVLRFRWKKAFLLTKKVHGKGLWQRVFPTKPSGPSQRSYPVPILIFVFNCHFVPTWFFFNIATMYRNYLVWNFTDLIFLDAIALNVIRRDHCPIFKGHAIKLVISLSQFYCSLRHILRLNMVVLQSARLEHVEPSRLI